MVKTIQKKRPIVGITLGDPAGIGPEIICKALRHKKLFTCCRPVIIGDLTIITREANNQKLKFKFLETKKISSVTPTSCIPVYNLPTKHSKCIQKGSTSPEAGLASYTYITKAVELAQAGEIDAITTAPITKESIKLAGLPYIDHTQILSAHVKGTPITILATKKLKVAHVMRHHSLVESVLQLSIEKIVTTIIHTAKGLEKTYGICNPKLIVAGLNPHNGDNGIMGDEEGRIIQPAVLKARQVGINAIGPIAADSAFPQVILGEADAAVALYHDQGHIAIKVDDWRGSYTVTIGMNVIRTSPNHGSALTISTKGLADEKSFLEAIYEACRIIEIKRSMRSGTQDHRRR